MARAFDFESFYDFIEVLHELKFFLEGEAEIAPFNYLDAYLFIRRSVDDGDLSTSALHMLNDAICHVNTTHPAFHSARNGKTTEMKHEILGFIDLLDEWRISTSQFYGLPHTMNHAYAFCLLCEMYCDENEPAYSAIYSHQRSQIEGALPPKTHQQIKHAISHIRQSHFTLPAQDSVKSVDEIEKDIVDAREKLYEWEKNNGIPSLHAYHEPFQRSELTGKMMKHLGIEV